MPTDSSRKIPSDARPDNIGKRLRILEIAKGIKLARPSKNGPHYKAMVDYLKRFVGTPHERAVFEVYFESSRPDPRDFPLIEAAAAKAGLDAREYIYRETLGNIKRFVRRSGIADDSRDNSAWVEAGQLAWSEKFTTYRQFTTFLGQHPEIRQRPSPTHGRRREINAGDWAKYWAGQGRACFEKLGDDQPSIADDPEADAEFLIGAAERIGKLRAKKKGR